ncbi:MAG: hypothetical protein IT162_13155 [Bryobacterales bacterium]|nr:hypothetical protein [Bryobacterales bacterium]
MAKTRDVLSKLWLRRGQDGILSRRLCGGQIVEHLPTEQPRISNRQADLLVRNDRGEYRHVEIEGYNEDDVGFGFRMLEYYVYYRREYGAPISQCVLYIGAEPLRMSAAFEEGGTTHRFEMVNLQDYTAEELLASPDWGDNLWALGAQGDRVGTLSAILVRLKALPPEEREDALAELTAYSGIMKLDGLLQEKLKENPMLEIDLSENAVLRPFFDAALRKGRDEGIEEGRDAGREEGRAEGREEGRRDTLRRTLVNLLSMKFGSPLPVWARERVASALPQQLDDWTQRVLRCDSLEDILA